jgi:predicted metalloprotease with PDZ domain
MTPGSTARGGFLAAAFRRARLPFVIALSLVLVAAHPTSATIRYNVSFDHPERHAFNVFMYVDVPKNSKDVDVSLPAWNALYQVRDFFYRTRQVVALAVGGEQASLLDIRKIDKDTWRISIPKGGFPNELGKVQVGYSIEWNDPGPFNSQLDGHHAFINLAEILMYVPGRRAEDAQVTFENIPVGWNIATELVAGPEPASFNAPSYDALVDAPVEAGKFDEFEFDSGGAHFRVIVDANDGNNSNQGRLEGALRRITGYELQLMGGPPFEQYTFFFHIGPNAEVGGGGMEHANSTAIAATSVERAAAIAAHEFFHAWNVKRIRPQSLEPVDYAREQYSRALWFAEGVTNTYAAYALERTGLWSKNQFYADFSAQVCALESRPARLWQSVEESSLDAWLEKYDAYNAPDRSISYYGKGQILGVLLDLAIRDATGNRKSLDDVFRRMNDEYARAGKFYNDSEGIRAVVEEMSGKSFEDFFRRYVSGTSEIPYRDFLAIAGLELTIDGVQPANHGARADSRCSVTEIAHPTDRQRRIRDGVLHGSTD